MNDDLALLHEYARRNSEEAFATLVSRYVNLVYSVALRQAHDRQLAEEITQAVFIILARKAGSLDNKTILSGWLCRTARYASANALTIQRRRQHREQESPMQSILNEPESNETWAQIAPLLDVAMERLGRKDHDALVLRFFENRNFKEVGTALGASEDAAKMRVSRALGKLRKFFAKRGVSSTTATLAETISVNSIYAAPVALAKTISAVALAKGATASVSTLTLIKGALKIMAWTKAKTAVAAGVGILIAAGTTTLTVKEIEAHRTPVWQKKYDLAVLNQLPPQTRILSPPASRPAMEIAGMIPGGKRMGLGQTFPSILIAAYGLQFNPGQLIFTAPIPAGRYDFICNLPQGQDQALQQEIKKKFGLIARHEVIQTNILLLKIHSGNGTGLRRSGAGQVSYSEGPGSFSSHRQNLFAFVGFLQRRLGALVIDQTQLNGDLDIDLNWDSTSDGLERAMLEQLGLELVPGRGPVEMLVVEKAK